MGRSVSATYVFLGELKYRHTFKMFFSTCRTLSDVVDVSRKYTDRTHGDPRANEIRDLIMRQGVTIDECAEKYDTTPRKICQLMGWE